MKQYSAELLRHEKNAKLFIFAVTLASIAAAFYLFHLRMQITTLCHESLVLEQVEDRISFGSQDCILNLDDITQVAMGVMDANSREGGGAYLDELSQYLFFLQRDERMYGKAEPLVLDELQRLQEHIPMVAQKHQQLCFVISCIISILLGADSLLLLFIFLKRRNHKEAERLVQRMDERYMDILEQDKNLVACELHDDLAQKLAQINRYFQDPEGEKDSVDLLKRYSGEAIQQIRMVTNRLKTPRIQDQNPREAFETLFSDFSVLTGINLEYSLIGLSYLKVSGDILIHAYRIVQELLNNAIKHSGAEKLYVAILYSHPELLIKYSDDGIGYDPKLSRDKGLGLESIRFRMDYLKAEYLNYSTDGGVELSIRIPIV